MRNCFTAFAACLLAGSPLGAQTQTPTTYRQAGLGAAYDRMSDSTTVWATLFASVPMIGRELTSTLMYRFPGATAPDGPISVARFEFMSSGSQSEGAFFDQRHDLLLLVDDSVRFSLPGEYKSNNQAIVMRNRLNEQISVPVPLETMIRLGSAQKIEGRLGDRQFTLNAGQIRKLSGAAACMATPASCTMR